MARCSVFDSVKDVFVIFIGINETKSASLELGAKFHCHGILITLYNPVRQRYVTTIVRRKVK